MNIDPKTKEMLDLLYPDFKVRVIRVYADMWENHRLQMRSTEGMRTFATQAHYYAQGRTIPGPQVTPQHPLGKTITDAQPGLSNHSYGVAIDSCFVGPDPYLEKAKLGQHFWQEYAKFAEGHGLRAGLRFKKVDGPHIELMYGGLTVHDLFDLYKHGGLKAVWAKFDQIRGVPEGSEWAQMKFLDQAPLQV